MTIDLERWRADVHAGIAAMSGPRPRPWWTVAEAAVHCADCARGGLVVYADRVGEPPLGRTLDRCPCCGGPLEFGMAERAGSLGLFRFGWTD